MQKKIAILLFIVMTSLVPGKGEPPGYNEVIAQFKTSYNQMAFGEIFKRFGPEMKKAMPLPQCKSFLQRIRIVYGKIVHPEFKKIENGFAVYQTDFELGKMNILLSIDRNSKIDGFSMKGIVQKEVAEISRNKTPLILPFNGRWYCVWGGDTQKQNYHVVFKPQKNAFDFLIVDDQEKSHVKEGKKNEDYYCFAKKIIAPCDGEVVAVIKGVKDNPPGVMNKKELLGNAVILKNSEGLYLYFCHLKEKSIAVKLGQKVKRAELLGLCGNSGNSSQAHLHFHIQNRKGMNLATGVKCFFERVTVNEKLKKDYSPVRADVVSNHFPE